jgi:tRNA A37 N6-isopentenylltransferase MiaA
VLLAQAHGFQKPADDVRLHEALDLYTASRGAIDQPESAYVSIKADFGSGQVHLVGFLDDLPGWSDEEARQLFQRVIRAYDSERAPEIQWLAGESHYYLAALAKQREAWQQVEEECREAIKLLEPLPVENTCEHVTQCWWWKADAEAQQRHFADARRDSELMLAAGKKCMRQNQLDEWKKTLDMLLQGAQRSSNPTADGSK